MKLSVCPRCGSKNISAGKMSSGILYGISSWTQECRNCGYKGSPIIFNSEKEYLKFLKDIKSDILEEINPKKEIKEKSKPEVKKKDQTHPQIKDQEPVDRYHWHTRTWWIEIIIAVLLAMLVSLFGILNNISLFGMEVGIVYTGLEFIIFFIFIVIAIAIVEYIIYLMRIFVHKEK